MKWICQLGHNKASLIVVWNVVTHIDLSSAFVTFWWYHYIMRKLVFLNVLQIVPNRLFINFSLYYKKKSFCSNETMRKSDVLMISSEHNKSRWWIKESISLEGWKLKNRAKIEKPVKTKNWGRIFFGFSPFLLIKC